MISLTIEVALASALALSLTCGSAFGQTVDIEAPDAYAPAPTSAPASSAPAPAEARPQDIESQLAQTANGDERFRLLTQLSRSYYRAGQVNESLRVRTQLVDDEAISPGKRSLVAAQLALSLALLNQHVASDRMIVRAKALAQQTSNAELEQLSREPAYAHLEAQAEVARRFDFRHDVALARYREHADLAWRNLNDSNLSEKRRRAAANELLKSTSDLTRVLLQNNRRDEALSYVNEINWYIDHRPDLKPTTEQRAEVQLARALALCSFDDYEAALDAISQSMALYRQAGIPEHDTRYGEALRFKLMIALALGTIRSFGADADALDRARAVNPVLVGSASNEELESLTLAARGKWADADARIQAAIDRRMRSEGPESPYVKYRQAMQMLYRLNDPQARITRSTIERYVRPLMGSQDEWSDSATRGVYVEDGALVAAMDWLMRPGRADSDIALAFQISELLQTNATQGAMLDGAARLAAIDPALRGLIEQEQTLRYEERTSRNLFSAAANKLDRVSANADADPEIIKRQTKQVEERSRALKEQTARVTALRREIAKAFPGYRELRAPVIPSPEKLGASLQPNEAYVSLYAGRTASYAFVVKADGRLHAVRLDVTRARLTELTLALRSSFDAGAPPRKAGELAGFDVKASASLFNYLIAPIQPALGDARTVYLSASGVVASLPFNVLTSRPAAALNNADWWIGVVTPVRIPSASALVLERAQKGRPANAPLIAFAAPSFNGEGSVVSAGTSSSRARPLRSDTTLASFDYRMVTPLPETLEEAQAIASVLAAPAASIVTGTYATRSEVLNRDLSDDRVVLFATHGVVAGEIPGLRKAGLALAYEGRGLADSVLTIDDIIPLRLNADWVVLSACNTGFVTGAAGDSIAALIRGFFAAGARSLLVTQWPVESESAKQLTVGLFTSYAQDSSLTKADALARVQRDMLAGKYGALYQHPYFWGAYFLAGDAGRR
ncbi:CHAT domain-containing protein [Caballeronia grimmiae]|uniref:CHAT domain-containing protein n=1 Tax=Caballeronia grimmiae TaxID=1071679 RepID=A0A069NF36_9BURK|nr:CHAT domain-containing protein [Caballeronia grimmiae]KDR26687.1 hypothetical protein BG57_25900 [Caballeronia grimmiae]GGD96634.1 hypothetical protein GCM10010985_59130 [Caballeronia grimmiae]